MRDLVEDIEKLKLTNLNLNNNNNSNNTNSHNISSKKINISKNIKIKTNSNSLNNKNNNNNNTNSSKVASSTSMSKNAVATPTALRKTRARPKSTADFKSLTQSQQMSHGAINKNTAHKQQLQRPKSSIISSSNNNNNNSNNYIKNNNTSKKSSASKSGQSTSILVKNVTATGTAKVVAPDANNTNDELAGGVQDTIYLCNFRVSVDGEWLCLKELQDFDCNHLTSKQQQHTVNPYGYHGTMTRHASLSSWQKNKRFSGILSQNDENARDPAEIERSNLVNICKLVVKEILEQSLRYGRMLDSDHLPLQHFFIVIEHVLGHGLRQKKGLLGPRRELWDLLQSVENYCPEAVDITASVRDLPTVRTHIGRARAWLRIALMQKKLSDYLHALIEHREEALFEYYEPHALMLSDEIVVIMGILVGLNVIDCNLCVKEEDLDSQQGVIDFSLYLRSSSRTTEVNDHLEATNQTIDANGQGNMIAVLDQKNYIEELNRHLNATVGNLQSKVEALTTTNALMKEDLAIARNSLLALQAENQAMRSGTGGNHSTGPASINSTHSDHSGGFNQKEDKETIGNLAAELNDLRKRHTDLEKELKLQVSLKAESDMAMKLLEKDIHEKQDTIVLLRRQLEEIKQINLEMYRKLQECEDELTQKGEMVARLQTKAIQIGNLLQSLEKKYETKLDQQPGSTSLFGSNSNSGECSPGTRRQQNLQKFEALTKKHKNDIGPPTKRLHLKADAFPPFNPNQFRKSPTVPVTDLVSLTNITTNINKMTESVTEDVTLKTPTSAKSFCVEAELNFNEKTIIDSSKSDYTLSQEKSPN